METVTATDDFFIKQYRLQYHQVKELSFQEVERIRRDFDNILRSETTSAEDYSAFYAL